MALSCIRKHGTLLLCRAVSGQSANYSISSELANDSWSTAVKDAESIVGEPSNSYINLNSLLTEALTHVGSHLDKLVSSEHPLVNTARRMLHNDPPSLRSRGLMVQLMSKTVGLSQDYSTPVLKPVKKFTYGGDKGDIADYYALQEEDLKYGILNSQRTLADITEMIYTAQILHGCIVNLHYGDKLLVEESIASNYEIGNKLAILSGDYLLAHACRSLASLQNPSVVAIMSRSIADYTMGSFVGKKDTFGRAIPLPTFKVEDWEELTSYRIGALIAKSNKSSLILAQHKDNELLDTAHKFGHHLAMALQGNVQIRRFIGAHSSSVSNSGSLEDSMFEEEQMVAMNSSESHFSWATTHSKTEDEKKIFSPYDYKVCPMSLPVVMHYQNMVAEGQKEKLNNFTNDVINGRINGENVDQMILDTVTEKSAPGIEAARQLVQSHCAKARSALEILPKCESREAQMNLITALSSSC